MALKQLQISANVVGKSNNETGFPHQLLLTKIKVPNIRRAFANGLSADIKFSKFWLYKMVQLGGFLGKIHGTLLKNALPLIGNVLKPLAKGVLIPLWLMATVSTKDAVI